MGTKTYTTSVSAYTALDAGACVVEMQGQGAIRVHVGTSLPATDITAFHILSYPAGTFIYNGTQTVYVQSDDTAIPDIVVTHVE